MLRFLKEFVDAFAGAIQDVGQGLRQVIRRGRLDLLLMQASLLAVAALFASRVVRGDSALLRRIYDLLPHPGQESIAPIVTVALFVAASVFLFTVRYLGTDSEK